MDKFRRLALYAIAAILGVFLIQTWYADYPPKTTQSAKKVATKQTENAHAGTFVPHAFNPASIPRSGVVDHAQKVAPVISRQGIITVKTDLFQLGINPDGGNIVSTHLLQYPVSYNKPHDPIQILSPDSEKLYVTQSGLTDTGSNKPVTFHATKDHYTLAPGQKTLTVTLVGHSANGLLVTKTITVKHDDYAIAVKTAVKNDSSKVWQGSFYHQIVHRYIPLKHAFMHHQSYSGAAISTPTVPYDQLSFAHMAEHNLSQAVKGGWVAMQQPYFLTSWVQPKNTTSHFYTHSQGDGKNGANNVFTVGYVGAKQNLAPKAMVSNESTLYIGPELSGLLSQVDPTLTHTIDYGWLAPVSIFLFWIMTAIFSVVGNWGWTIILITLLIKIVFFALSDKSYKSMAKMREAQPRIKQLQERYGDDKQALNKATMEFYKREKLNPMGGCLPMLIQIPVFFALYYVLIESVQLRQAPWIWWIHDLAVKDPYYILPVLMGLSMLAQQKLSPPPPDPTQAKVMMVMPLMFMVFFLWFPAGLVLYWLTNNVLSLLHQWYVMKSYDPKKAQHQRKNRVTKK